MKRVASAGEPEKLYAAALALRQRNDHAGANRMRSAALFALEQRSGAKVSLAAGGASGARWYHGPLPSGAPVGPLGALLVETADAVLLVDASTGLELGRLAAPAPRTISPDQAWLVAGADETTKLWSVRELRDVAPLAGSEKVVFDPSSKLLAAVVRQREVEVLELGTLARRVLFRGVPPADADADASLGALDELAFSPDGTVLVARSNDGKLTLIDVASGSVRLAASTVAMSSYAAQSFSADSRWFAWNGPDSLEAFELRSGRRVRARLQLRVTALGLHPTREEIAVGGELGRLLVYDLRTGRSRTLARGWASTHREESTGSFVSAVEYTPDGSHLVFTVGANPQLVDAKSGAAVSWPGSCSPDRASRKGAVLSWGWIMPDAPCAGGGAPTAWSRSGRLFAGTASGGGRVSLVDWPARRILWEANGDGPSYAYSDDERWLLTGAAMFDAASGRRLPAPRLESAAGSVSAIRFDAQGTLYSAVDFGRGTEACTLARGRALTCEWGRGVNDAVLGRRPLFFGYRTLAWHGQNAEQVQELRKPDGQLVASGDVSTSFFSPPSSELIAAVSEKVRFFDANGASLGDALAAPPNAAAAFDRRSELLAVWGHSASSAEVRVFEVKGRRQIMATSLPRLATRAPVAVAVGGSRLAIAEPGHVRWLELKTGQLLASVDAPNLDLFAASETEALLLTATAERDEAKREDISRVRVFSLEADKSRLVHELSLPRIRQVEWAPGSKGWLAVTARGLSWVERSGARQATIDVFPTGIAARWSDGVVDLHAGAKDWLMCESKSFALPADACEDRFVALDAPEPEGPRGLW